MNVTRYLYYSLVLTPPKHIGQHRARIMINRMPQPTRIRFLGHIRPHFIELRAEPMTHLQLIRAPDFHFDLRGIQGR